MSDVLIDRLGAFARAYEGTSDGDMAQAALSRIEELEERLRKLQEAYGRMKVETFAFRYGRGVIGHGG